jgi:hypothetical protein
VRFSAFVNVASNRNRKFSCSRTDFDNPAFTAIVPGPSSIPTPALPIRAAPTGVGANALRLKICPGWLPANGFPTRSGRQTDPAASGSVFVWSSAQLIVGVRYGPDSISVTVLTVHPPKIPFTTRLELALDFEPLQPEQHFVTRHGPRLRCCQMSIAPPTTGTVHSSVISPGTKPLGIEVPSGRDSPLRAHPNLSLAEGRYCVPRPEVPASS